MRNSPVISKKVCMRLLASRYQSSSASDPRAELSCFVTNVVNQTWSKRHRIMM